MKTIAHILLIAVLPLAAQTTRNTKKTTPPAAVPAEVVIPKGAVERPMATSITQTRKAKSGCTARRPSASRKWKISPSPAQAAEQEDKITVATDAGDSVHFEKPSPFGTVKWDKKKTELDSNEQSIWNRQKKQ